MRSGAGPGTSSSSAVSWARENAVSPPAPTQGSEIAGTWREDGLLSRVVGYSWVLIASYLALRAARRIRDPFAL